VDVSEHVLVVVGRYDLGSGPGIHGFSPDERWDLDGFLPKLAKTLLYCLSLLRAWSIGMDGLVFGCRRFGVGVVHGWEVFSGRIDSMRMRNVTHQIRIAVY
jgi:hypothetical protein